MKRPLLNNTELLGKPIPCIWPDKTAITDLSHFFPEFNNDPTIKLIDASPGISNGFYETSATSVAAGLKEYNTPNSKFIFCDLYEGIFFFMLIDRIHKIIEILKLNPADIYFITGTLNVEEVYKDYCNTHNITTYINIYSVNYWEMNLISTSCTMNRKNNIRTKNKTFLCFNRIVRDHRIALLGLLLEKNLVQQSFYSFFPDKDYVPIPARYNNNLYEYLRDRVLISFKTATTEFKQSVCEQIKYNMHTFPLRINIDKGTNKNFISADDIALFDDSYFSLVTETGFVKNNGNTNTVFLSEKIYKPILMKHPFILVSSENSLKYLRQLGYKTFHPFINESYDNIYTDALRLKAIVDEVERLSHFTPREWLDWQNNINDILEHNHSIITSRKSDEYAFSKFIPNS